MSECYILLVLGSLTEEEDFTHRLLGDCNLHLLILKDKIIVKTFDYVLVVLYTQMQNEAKK